MAYHPFLVNEGGLSQLVQMMGADDIETQEYSTFAIARMSSNHDYQVMHALPVIYTINNHLKLLPCLVVVYGYIFILIDNKGPLYK